MTEKPTNPPPQWATGAAMGIVLVTIIGVPAILLFAGAIRAAGWILGVW